MTAAAAVVRTFAVGAYRCTLTIPRAGMEPGGVYHATCEWEPCRPTRLTPAEWLVYQSEVSAAAQEAKRG